MANDRQISQLVLQVDANIAVAQRELQQLARVVRQQTGDINNSLATTEVAHERMGRAFGQARIAQMELSHVVTASVDAYAAGFSPLRIMTLEMGRLAEAATFLGGSGGGGVLGKLAGFMGGPWGIAVLLGVSVLSQLFAKMGQGEDSVSSLVDKMRKQAAQAAASKIADQEWAGSVDGLIDRNVKLIDTLQKRLKAEEDLDAQTLRQAHGDEAKAEQALRDATQRLKNLQAQQAATQTGVGVGQGGAPTGASSALAGQIAQAKQDVLTARAAFDAAAQAVVQNTIAVGEAEGKAAVDATAAIDLWSKKYLEFLHQIEQQAPGAAKAITSGFYAVQKALQDGASAKVDINSGAHQVKLLGDELKSGKLTAVAYAEAMKKVAAALEAAAEAAKNAKKGAGEFGKQISFADAASIAKGAGLTVTSGYRSTAHQAELYNDPRYNRPGNPVARPGMSAHEGVNGKWALDIAFADGLTAEKLKKLYGDQGVTLSAVYKEKGHFHIEGSRSQAAAQEKADARAAQKSQVDDDQFARESAALDAEIISARKQLLGGYDSQARAAKAELDAQQAAQLQAIKKQVDGQQITAAQGQILSAKVRELADAKKADIDNQEYLRTLDQTLKVLEQQLQFETDDLKFADDMARTQGEHRTLQLQILDIQYEQKKAELEYQLMLIKRNTDFATSAALQNDARLKQQEIDRLPTEKSQDQERVRQGTLNPLEQWAKQVPQTAAQINEALQSIEVQGIDNLASGIADVINGTKSLGDVFHDIASQIIADIIQMTIKMLIFKAISAVAGAIGGGGGGGGDAGAFTDVMNGGIPGFATGGSFMIGGNGGVDNNQLSLNGTPIARVSHGETLAVIPRASRINVGGANGGSAPIELIIQTVPSDDAWGKVQVISAQHANQAVRVSVNHTNDTVRSLTRSRLMGGRG